MYLGPIKEYMHIKYYKWTKVHRKCSRPDEHHAEIDTTMHNYARVLIDLDTHSIFVSKSWYSLSFLLLKKFKVNVKNINFNPYNTVVMSDLP